MPTAPKGKILKNGNRIKEASVHQWQPPTAAGPGSAVLVFDAPMITLNLLTADLVLVFGRVVYGLKLLNQRSNEGGKIQADTLIEETEQPGDT